MLHYLSVPQKQWNLGLCLRDVTKVTVTGKWDESLKFSTQKQDSIKQMFKVLSQGRGRALTTISARPRP